MIRDIAGRHNHSVKLARKLQKKKHRRERGLLVGEGWTCCASRSTPGRRSGDVLVRRDVWPQLPAALVERAQRRTSWTSGSVPRRPWTTPARWAARPT